MSGPGHGPGPPKIRRLDETQQCQHTHNIQLPQYEKRRKCPSFLKKQVIQRREEFFQNLHLRQQVREFIIDRKEQIATTQNLRGRAPVRKRSPVCLLSTCPKRVKMFLNERRVDKRFRKNEQPKYNRYPGYASTDEEEFTAVSQISNDSGRRSRSPLIVSESQRHF